MAASTAGAGACAAALLLAAACSAPRYEEVTLRVSDAQTGAAISGAQATIRPLKFYLPMEDSPSPTPGDFAADSGLTDAEGRAILRAAANAPSEVTVSHPGYATWRGLIEPWETISGTLDWRLEPAHAPEDGFILLIEVLPE